MAVIRKRRKRPQPQFEGPTDRRVGRATGQSAVDHSETAKVDRRLQQMNNELRERVEELERAGKRQAEPFAAALGGKAKEPGRKHGQGKFAHRELPKVQQVHETKEKLQGCPDCGGKLKEIHTHEQYVQDIPVVEVQTTRFVTYSGYCRACHKRVRSHHPEQTSDATGAAGVLVGPRAKALAADLKHRLGVSYGKVSEVLNDTFGLQVSRSGWCQADQKAGPHS